MHTSENLGADLLGEDGEVVGGKCESELQIVVLCGNFSK